MKHVYVMPLIVVLAACDKSNPTPEARDAATSQLASATDAATDSGAASGGPVSYAGKYTAEPATYFIPSEKDWKGTKQAKDDPEKLVGEGTLSISVDASGAVSGTIDSGPASPAVISGRLDGDSFAATVHRKDPSDEGLYGTATGTRKGKAVEGVLKLSDGRAALLREAKFSAEQK